MQQHDVSRRHNRDFAGPRALLAVLASTAFLYGCPDGSVDLPETIIPNTDPIANAGADQTLLASETADLDGSASSDPDGDVFTHTWSFDSVPSGSAAALSDTSTVNPSFETDIPGNYIVLLTVEDVFGGIGTDTVTVTAEEVPTRPPVANAGPDQDVTFQQAGLTVFLDGSGSSDPDGDPLTYSWEITNFSPAALDPMIPVTLIDPDTASPIFDIFETDHRGEYTIELTVSDGILSDTDTVIVTVAKSFPTASLLLGSGLAIGAFAGIRRRQRRRI